MRLARLILAIAAITALATAILPHSADAQAWPSRPVRMLVPFPPGGATDNAGRAYAEKLSLILGQQIVVENRGGAGGAIGVEAGAKSAPDGYTIIVVPMNTLAIIPHIRKTAYDPFTDLIPVGRICDQIFGISVRPGLGVNTLPELIALAKQKPGQINFGSAGLGTTTQLTIEVLKQVAGIDLVHIPYKGSSEALTDLLAGQIDMFAEGNVFPSAKAGKIKVIAIVGPARYSEFPDVPLVSEILPDYTMGNWYGIAVPAGTPAEIVAKLNAAMNKAAAEPELKARLLQVGLFARPDTPDAMAADMKKQSAYFADLVTKLNLRTD